MKVVTYPALDNNQSLFSKLRSVSAIVTYMLAHRFDVIHVQSPYLSFIPWLLHKRFVSTLHVNDLVRCFYYKNATHLIAISNETKAYAKGVFGYQDSEITIVNHGVDIRFAKALTPEEKRDEKRRLDIPADKIVVGMVGSVERRKGHDLLLQAVKALPEELSSRLHMVFLGSSKDGKTNEWLDRQIEQSGLAKQVSRFEYQSPERFYKLFDIFTLPSRLEGFGLVVIEAMLSGCCCVRSDTEGAFEQIDNGKTGFIFENENVPQFSAILKQLVENPGLLKEVAQCGKQKALRQFTAEVMARNTMEIYKKIMS